MTRTLGIAAAALLLSGSLAIAQSPRPERAPTDNPAPAPKTGVSPTAPGSGTTLPSKKDMNPRPEQGPTDNPAAAPKSGATAPGTGTTQPTKKDMNPRPERAPTDNPAPAPKN